MKFAIFFPDYCYKGLFKNVSRVIDFYDNKEIEGGRSHGTTSILSACNMVKTTLKDDFYAKQLKKKLRLVKTVIPELKEPLR